MPFSGSEGVPLRQEILWCFAPDLNCMIFLSHLHWRDWAINPVYFVLLHTCILQWLPTHDPEKLCSRGRNGANSCRWSMLYVWSPLSTLHKKKQWLLLQIAESELFMTVLRILFWYPKFYISDMQDDVAERQLPYVWMICCVSDHVPFKLSPVLNYLTAFLWLFWRMYFFSFSASVLESIRHLLETVFVDCAFLYMPYFKISFTLRVYFQCFVETS